MINHSLNATVVFFLFIIATVVFGNAESSVEDFRVQQSSHERILHLVGENEVVDMGSSPQKRWELHKIEPSITVAVSRVAQVPDLAASVRAASWEQASVGGYYTFLFMTPREALSAAVALNSRGYDATPNIHQKKHSRFTPQDPFFTSQWNLSNQGQLGGISGIDLNLSKAWDFARGKGISVAVVDDGLQTTHPDLSPNCFPMTSNRTASMHFDFNGDDTNPAPTMSDQHGTAVAGVLAAASNGIGGIGVAPDARLAGIRLTAEETTSATDAAAFGWKNSVFQIYNNSWGPNDDGATIDGPDSIAKDSIKRAILFGRGGLGNIFIWAGGNGRESGDESNYDGYANSIYTIAVGAISDRAVLSSESESGANIVVVAPSSSLQRQGLITTDLVGKSGYNSNGANDGAVIPAKNCADLNYTNDFGMTSGATPQVSGVVALMLQRNLKLGWRDVQEILIRSSRRILPTDSDWKSNSAGLYFNHKFGAGLVDAMAAITLASTWKNLAASTNSTLSQKNLSLLIPDNSPTGATLNFNFSNVQKSLRVEHVEFSVSLTHPYVGDLKFVLTSPSGMKSVVNPRENDGSTYLSNWTFMSVRHWGESSKGIWKLTAIDTATGDKGKLTAAMITLHGTPIRTTGVRK